MNGFAETRFYTNAKGNSGMAYSILESRSFVEVFWMNNIVFLIKLFSDLHERGYVIAGSLEQFPRHFSTLFFAIYLNLAHS